MYGVYASWHDWHGIEKNILPLRKVILMKFTVEEILADMPLYAIFMVIGDGWYVGNKSTRKLKRFGFNDSCTYLDVLEYAESII